MTPYSQLLFQLIFLKESKDEVFVYGGSQLSELNDVTDPEEAVDEPTALEIFILVIKTCLNKPVPNMTVG